MPAADQANASQADPPGLTVSVSVSALQHLIIEVLRRPVEFTQDLRRENSQLKQVVTEAVLENRVLKNNLVVSGAGDDTCD